MIFNLGYGQQQPGSSCCSAGVGSALKCLWSFPPSFPLPVVSGPVTSQRRSELVSACTLEIDGSLEVGAATF